MINSLQLGWQWHVSEWLTSGGASCSVNGEEDAMHSWRRRGRKEITGFYIYEWGYFSLLTETFCCWPKYFRKLFKIVKILC